MAAEFTVTGEVPVDRSVRDCGSEVPTVILPKLRELVLTLSSGFAAAIPVPDNATTVIAPVEELLRMESWPLAAATVVG
jgi:hypothetical protein